MDSTPLYDDCAFLKDWSGVPVGNEEGEIISSALGDKRAILLAHHGQLVTGATIEEACILAILIERAARLQLLAMAAENIQPLDPDLGREAHDWTSTDRRSKANFAYSGGEPRLLLRGRPLPGPPEPSRSSRTSAPTCSVSNRNPSCPYGERVTRSARDASRALAAG
ncbi:class II aldolase/adducin family protein [Streptomyces sp. NPDC088246]|uniref:class II aldolase/adducin family protein n=1 Tax=Streptomyces sp. NPDC088246 TaxID=3365842 RepID=UPI0037FF0541